MPEDINNSEFYWDPFFLKVEDELFCVPRCEFVQSSEVFADMFLLPFGPATSSEGQDRDHPIILEGYKKDEFTSLLKVMYPRATSLISGKNIELNLKKEEWVSALKLSTIWNMTKIRQYAIHWLSTNVTLSLIEKILLGRAHRVGAWLDEGVTSLATCDFNLSPTLEDLATLGWETAARIVWINNYLRLPLRFRRDSIKCGHCSSSSSLIESNYCGHIASANSELLTCCGSASVISGTNELLIPLGQILCPICGDFLVMTTFRCSYCRRLLNAPSSVRIVTVNKSLKTMIEEMFGEEIKDYEPSLLDSIKL